MAGRGHLRAAHELAALTADLPVGSSHAGPSHAGPWSP